MKRTTVDDGIEEGSTSVVRMIACLAVLAGATILEHSVTSDIPYFATGGVLFCVGLLALGSPQLFWTSRRSTREQPDAKPAAITVQGEEHRR